MENKVIMSIGGASLVFILLLVLSFLFSSEKTLGVYILIFLLTAVFFLFLWMILIILRSSVITNFIGKITQAIFGAVFVCILILTTLLGMQWISGVFASIYILLGSIIVAIIGLYLNHKIGLEKEQRQIKRIVIALKLTVEDNKKSAESILIDIKENSPVNLKVLKMGVWDTFAYNIITADFDPVMLEELISIRALTSELNEELSERNNLVNQESIFDTHDQYFQQVCRLDNKLKVELEAFIRYSGEYLKKIDKI